MKGPCTLVPYIRENGNSPVLDFLQDLENEDPDAFAVWEDVTEPMIREFGTDIGMPHFRPLGKGLAEIRWHHKKKRLRIYCSEESSERVAMYFGDVKKWRTFPPESRERAEKMQDDLRSREYSQTKRMALHIAKKGDENGKN